MQQTTASPTSRKAVKLHQHVAQVLREQIEAGHYPAASRLPTEGALMQQFGVSRITVRHALAALEHEQLITKRAGIGSFVAAAKPYQALERLLGFAEAMQPQGHTQLNRVVSFTHEAATPAVAAALHIASPAQVTAIQRVRCLDGQPVSLDYTWLPQHVGQALETEDLVRHDIFALLEQRSGVPLAHADVVLDAVAADTYVARLLEVEPGTPLLRIERLTYTQDGQALDYEHIFCRSDNFQFRLRIVRHPQHQTPHTSHANH